MKQTSKASILIVDDDLAFRVGTLAMLEDHGYIATAAANGAEAKRLVGERTFHLVLSDLVMPDVNGIELLTHIRAAAPGMPVIMVTGFASVHTAVEAMRLGARDYITKPCDNDELLIKIRRALQEQERARELEHLRAEVFEKYAFGSIVGRNEKITAVFKLVEQVAGTDVPVLILGETGTGKELVAKAIHYNSSRRERPFVVINCSALTETLLESELFGHEQGAFTGAHRQRIGKFEEAEGGTIFLDEVGDIPPHIQVKLLRVLQEGEIQRVGGSGAVPVDNRIVAATNRDLASLIASGQFREDLFYRLNVFPVHLPPLRERLDDVPMLAEHFLEKHRGLANGRTMKLSPALLPSMMNYPWKGNIRELENLIKRAIIKTAGETILSLEIPENGHEADPVLPAPGISLEWNTPFKEFLSLITRNAEETYLTHMLRLCKGNINQIARLMEIDRKTVYRKLTDLRIDPEPYRE